MNTNETKKLTVLFVDDEEACIRQTRILLRDSGYSVLTAKDGTEALAVMASAPQVDVIVTDVRMRPMGGIEFAQKAREVNLLIPVLFITGMSDDLDLARIKSFERSDLLLKPYDVYLLLQKIALMLADRVPA